MLQDDYILRQIREMVRAVMKMLFQVDENFNNYRQVYDDYKEALNIRTDRVQKLYDEIKIIKKLEI